MAQQGGAGQNPSNGRHPVTGQPLVKACSPAAGAHQTNPAGTGNQFGLSVGYAVGGSVLGTGINPDIKTYPVEI